MTTIEPLSLTQDRTAEVTDETTTNRYYGWDTVSGLTWGPSPVSPAGRGPDFACDVTLPAYLAGDAQEVQADIGVALRRHARALGISE